MKFTSNLRNVATHLESTYSDTVCIVFQGHIMQHTCNACYIVQQVRIRTLETIQKHTLLKARTFGNIRIWTWASSMLTFVIERACMHSKVKRCEYTCMHTCMLVMYCTLAHAYSNHVYVHHVSSCSFSALNISDTPFAACFSQLIVIMQHVAFATTKWCTWSSTHSRIAVCLSLQL